MISKNIVSIGFELECGINNYGVRKLRSTIRLPLRKNMRVTSDGSVNVRGYDNNCAEILFWATDFEDLELFLTEADRHIKTNSSCGFHVHIKTEDMKQLRAIFSYRVLWNIFLEDYKNYFKEGKYQNRITNGYCNAKYDLNKILSQEKETSKDCCRYKMINLSSVNIHNTLEFRIFPNQANAIEAISTLQWLIAETEKILEFKEQELLLAESPFFDAFLLEKNYCKKQEELNQTIIVLKKKSFAQSVLDLFKGSVKNV
jgi:hypothetical protein